jgi:hypothetical protein
MRNVLYVRSKSVLHSHLLSPHRRPKKTRKTEETASPYTVTATANETPVPSYTKFDSGGEDTRGVFVHITKEKKSEIFPAECIHTVFHV